MNVLLYRLRLIVFYLLLFTFTSTSTIFAGITQIDTHLGFFSLILTDSGDVYLGEIMDMDNSETVQL